jgi:uncharacterized membrane protein
MIMRRLNRLLLLGFLAFSFVPSFVSAAEESIKEFDTKIVINTDGTIDVTEKILYDFSDNSRHGIFRDIILSRQTTEGIRSIQVADVSVVDENGNSLPFTEPYKSGYREIKIGDPDSFVMGLKTYEISYTVYGAIGYFEGYDEIYWNTTGNEWEVPIESASAQVVLPKFFESKDLRISCYYGVYSINNPCPKSEPIVDTGLLASAVEFSSGQLSSGEGMTVAVGFPKGYVSLPSRFTAIKLFIYSYPLVFLPLLVLIIMTYLWYKYGRDPKGSPVIVPEYNVPYDLTPIEVAGILYQKIDSKMISAEIIYLATKGFIKVTRIEKKGFFGSEDYQLDLLPISSAELSVFDQTLLTSLFSNSKNVKISDLKDSFYVHTAQINKGVFSALIAKGYYPHSPEEVTAKFSFFMVLGVFGFIAATESPNLLLSPNFWFGVISLVIVYLFAHIMPRKTELGMKAHDKILGLKDYLQIAEKDRLKFNNAPERTPERFERLLPYAMALEVEETWAKEFKDIYLQSPSWYNDTGNHAFNVMYFSSSLHNFRNESAGAMASTPSSSSGSGGGGFSGGGGGGGGGGSW